MPGNASGQQTGASRESRLDRVIDVKPQPGAHYSIIGFDKDVLCGFAADGLHLAFLVALKWADFEIRKDRWRNRPGCSGRLLHAPIISFIGSE